jgi:hypothetical protein
LEQEKTALAEDRGREIEGLKAAQAKLEQEKTALAEDRGREIEGLKAAQAQLESEKSALVGRREEAEKLAAERLKQINELQQQIQSRQAGEADLAARQQMMHEEMVRAEAQLDLIKDMLLREPGL